MAHDADNASGNCHQASKQSIEQEDELVQSLYDEFLNSASRHVAFGMHEMIKRGILSYYDVMTPNSRQDLYHYNSSEEMEHALRHYATEVADTSKRPRMASISDHNNNSEDALSAATVVEDVVEHQPNMQTRHAGVDIWGRIPLKEPKETATCPVCTRQISTLRFAPHLDKCMGIGTLSRSNHSVAP